MPGIVTRDSPCGLVAEMSDVEAGVTGNIDICFFFKTGSYSIAKAVRVYHVAPGWPPLITLPPSVGL